jgi:hypothetical protein
MSPVFSGSKNKYLLSRWFLARLFFLIRLMGGGVQLGPLGTAATDWPIVPVPGDCGAIGGMKIGRGNRSTRRNPVPASLCPPQIPLDQTRDRTRATAVGRQRLSCSAYSSTQNMEATVSSEISIQRTTWRYIPECYFVRCALTVNEVSKKSMI